MPTEISMPFRVGGDGRVVTTSDPDTQVRQHMLALVNTQPTERAMLPGYGVNTMGLLFEDADTEEIEAAVLTRVQAAATEWEPGIEIRRAVASGELGDTIARVDFEYARRDSALTPGSAQSNTAIISANGTVKEIVRG